MTINHGIIIRLMTIIISITSQSREYSPKRSYPWHGNLDKDYNRYLSVQNEVERNPEMAKGNLALGKNAKQSSEYWTKGGPAWKAVDGNNNGAYEAGSCTHTSKYADKYPLNTYVSFYTCYTYTSQFRGRSLITTMGGATNKWGGGCRFHNPSDRGVIVSTSPLIGGGVIESTTPLIGGVIDQMYFFLPQLGVCFLG